MNRESYAGFHGGWLRTPAIEAFLAADPALRVLALRRPGSVSPWWSADGDHLSGLRTWFMEPGQIAESGLPAAVTGEFIRDGLLAGRLRGPVEPITELSLEIAVTLDSTAPVARLRHTLFNHSHRSRKLALWSIIATPRSGRATVRVAPTATARRAILWPGLTANDPALHWRNEALDVDFTPRSENPALFKIGVATTDGTLIWRSPDTAIRSQVARQDGKVYPEGGGDVTFYAGRVAELEHVGHLVPVAAGTGITLDQTITLHDNARDGRLLYSNIFVPRRARESIDFCNVSPAQ